MKTHSEEYKFNCKFCNASFINRNVMVTHQRTCPFSTDETNGSSQELSGGVHSSGPTPTGSLQITPVLKTSSNGTSPPEKRMKVVLSGLKLKTFIENQTNGNSKPLSGFTSATVEPPQITVLPVMTSGNSNLSSAASECISGDSDDSSSGSLHKAGGGGMMKQVVRKRAPIFPFEPEDHYVPDNNSNNIIPKSDIEPPPTSAERRQGYCLRPFRDSGQQRYICTVCGKHYTTMYNMRQHRNIHTGSGLHSCRYCGRSFTHKHVWEVRPIHDHVKQCCQLWRLFRLESVAKMIGNFYVSKLAN